MKWVIAFLLLASAVFAQNTDFRPHLVQSRSPSTVNPCAITGSPITCSFDHNVTNGNIEGICDAWDNTGQAISVAATRATLTEAFGGPVSINDGSGVSIGDCWYGAVTSSGSETITITTASGHSAYTMFELTPASGGTLAIDTTCTNTGTTTTVSTSCTTTTDGDLLLTFGVSWPAANNPYSQNQFVGSGGIQHGTNLALNLAGAAGVYSSTIAGNQQVAAGLGLAVMTMAFKPSAIVVTSSKLPDCANGVACVWDMSAVGGAGAYTWSITAGSWPTGCSNSSLSSGGHVSCTASANGTFSLTWQVTDGTHTTTRVLPFTVGASFQTPAVVQECVSGAGSNQCTLNNVQKNDLILAWCNGPHSNGSMGWISATITDTLNDSYRQFGPTTGVGGTNSPTGTAIIDQFSAITNGCGNVTVISSAATPTLNSCAIGVAEISGVQDIDDLSTIATSAGFASSSPSLSSSSVTPGQTNELLVAAGTDGDSVSSLSIASPFTTTVIPHTIVVSSAAFLEDADQASGTPTVSATLNASGVVDTAQEALVLQVMGLRPGIVAPVNGCAPPAPALDKRRTHIPW